MKRRFKIRIERKIKRKIKERQNRMSKTRLVVQDLKNTSNNHVFNFANKQKILGMYILEKDYGMELEQLSFHQKVSSVKILKDFDALEISLSQYLHFNPFTVDDYLFRLKNMKPNGRQVACLLQQLKQKLVTYSTLSLDQLRHLRNILPERDSLRFETVDCNKDTCKIEILNTMKSKSAHPIIGYCMLFNKEKKQFTCETCFMNNSFLKMLEYNKKYFVQHILRSGIPKFQLNGKNFLDHSTKQIESICKGSED